MANPLLLDMRMVDSHRGREEQRRKPQKLSLCSMHVRALTERLQRFGDACNTQAYMHIHTCMLDIQDYHIVSQTVCVHKWQLHILFQGHKSTKDARKYSIPNAKSGESMVGKNVVTHC